MSVENEFEVSLGLSKLVNRLVRDPGLRNGAKGVGLWQMFILILVDGRVRRNLLGGVKSLNGLNWQSCMVNESGIHNTADFLATGS